MAPWALLTLGVSLNWFLTRQFGLVKSEWTSISFSAFIAALWPIGVGSAALGILLLPKHALNAVGRLRVPEGDIAYPLSFAAHYGFRALDALACVHVPRLYTGSVQRLTQTQKRLFHEMGDRLAHWIENGNAIGLLMAVLTAVLFAAMIL
jgi:hypothetical protein